MDLELKEAPRNLKLVSNTQGGKLQAIAVSKCTFYMLKTNCIVTNVVLKFQNLMLGDLVNEQVQINKSEYCFAITCPLPM